MADSDDEIIEAILRPIARFARRAISPRALLVLFVFSWSLWQFGASKALFIGLMAYLFIVTEIHKEIVLFLAVVAFTITSMKWLGLWEYLPTVALG